MVIDHIGIVVKSLDTAIARWRELFGYEPVTEPVVNTRNKVRVVFLEKPFGAGFAVIHFGRPD
jgi:methylmalonyl-CoA/ethylmalonyl-CoA epimerase